jgi:SAM-dependent methyltransferase
VTETQASCEVPVVDLEWSDGGSVDVRCPVCGHESGQSVVATAGVDWREAPVHIVRCAGCGSIVMSDVQPPTHYFDELGCNQQVESAAGIEVICELLTKAQRPKGAAMLDVGCGYGFALDLGTFVFGWRGVGLDPSVAAARGREELGLDIRAGYLDSALEAGEVFDVVFGSEVLEHVPDPRAFVGTLADRLAPDGVLLLTTPDSAVVRPDTEPTVLLAALSVGAHVFLVDAPGLERLLRDAGLEAVVWRDGPGLRAIAAHSAAALAAASVTAELSYPDLVRYCDARADSAELGSVLQVGMVARHLKFTVNLGELEWARVGLPRLRTALLARYGVDIEDLDGPFPPPSRGVLVGIHYFLGILALNGDLDPSRAAGHFAASARIAHTIHAENDGYWDPQIPAFEFVALGNRAIALASTGAKRRTIRDALADVDDAVVRGIGEASAAAEFRAKTELIRADRKTESRGRLRRRLRGK